MYNFLDKQIQTLNLERKWIRHELQGEVHNPKSLPDYPSGIEVAKQVEIMVHICDNVYKIKADIDFNYIHPCCTFPLTDIEIEVSDI